MEVDNLISFVGGQRPSGDDLFFFVGQRLADGKFLPPKKRSSPSKRCLAHLNGLESSDITSVEPIFLANFGLSFKRHALGYLG